MALPLCNSSKVKPICILYLPCIALDDMEKVARKAGKNNPIGTFKNMGISC